MKLDNEAKEQRDMRRRCAGIKWEPFISGSGMTGGNVPAYVGFARVQTLDMAERRTVTVDAEVVKFASGNIYFTKRGIDAVNSKGWGKT